MTQVSPHQTAFDEEYISGSEICKVLGICRTSVRHAIKTNFLPPPICVSVNSTFIWKRADIDEKLAAWKISLDRRRNK